MSYNHLPKVPVVSEVFKNSESISRAEDPISPDFFKDCQKAIAETLVPGEETPENVIAKMRILFDQNVESVPTENKKVRVLIARVQKFLENAESRNIEIAQEDRYILNDIISG